MDWKDDFKKMDEKWLKEMKNLFNITFFIEIP